MSMYSNLLTFSVMSGSVWGAAFAASPTITLFVVIIAAVGMLMVLWLSYGNTKTKCMVAFNLMWRFGVVLLVSALVGGGIGLGIRLIL